MYCKTSATTALLVLSSLVQSGLSFQPQSRAAFVTTVGRTATVSLKAATEDKELQKKVDDYEEPQLTELGLPELKGDFDWDAKFKGDDDWITEDVPGKIVLDEVSLAKQATAMDKLEAGWRKERLISEYDDDKRIGWVEGAEKLNGRAAMFFLVTGLLTELWTGYTIPGQVEEMLRIGGVIGFDG